MVDLDAVLNGLDPATRKDLQGLLRFGERASAGTGAQANDAFHYLNPALAQTSELTAELVRDEAALRRLIDTAATVSGALASRDTDIEEGVTNTAATLRAVASERDALGRTLARAPEVLRTSGRRLGRLSDGIESVSDTVPLARLLAESGPVLAKSRPLVRDLRPVLGDLRRTLNAFPAAGADHGAEPARHHPHGARDAADPHRPAPLHAGGGGGFGGAYFGTIGGYYDANGHYVRIAPAFANDSLPGAIRRPATGPGSPRAAPARRPSPPRTARTPGSTTRRCATGRHDKRP